MRRGRLFRMGISISAGLFLLLLLLASAWLHQHRTYSFVRQIMPHALSNGMTIPLPDRFTHYAGQTASRIYLRDPEDFTHLLEYDLITHQQHEHVLQMDSFYLPRDPEWYVQVDSPRVFVFDGKTPLILSGLLDQRLTPSHHTYPVFTQAVALPDHSLVLQTIIRPVAGPDFINVLGRTAADTFLLQPDSNVLRTPVNDYYSTTGQLRYSESLHQLVYVYFFRNEYVLADTTLKLICTGKTIDPIDRMPTAAVSREGNTYMFQSTPLVVNRMSRVLDHLLLIQSDIRAANEDAGQLSQAVIDVYDLRVRRYLHSFHIRSSAQRLLTDFRVMKGKLLAMYRDELVLYDFDPAPE